MKEKERFIKALSTLMGAWGGDTPPEAVWAGNELLEWYEIEYGVQLNIRFTECGEEPETSFEDIEAAIRQT